MSSRSYSYILTLLVIAAGCRHDKAATTADPYQKASGQTWGTYYSLTIQSADIDRHHQEVISILKSFDDALSTYIPTSAISQFNSSDEGYTLSAAEDKYFAPVLERSRELHESTQGYMDVTVMPLLNYWGFGYNSTKRTDDEVSDSEVQKLRKLLGLDHISRKEDSNGQVQYLKDSPKVEIDFSALAKGYGIDIIAQYFDEQNIENYLIDIGGEARCKGVNATGSPWTLAINKPYADADYTTQELVLQLRDQSIATSGNYREMYEVDGKVYGHILNPLTGYPEPSDVLSATVVADDCMTADALATACVAAGLAKAKEILAAHGGVHGCLIYDADGDSALEKYFTNKFENMVLAMPSHDSNQ